MSEYKDVKEPVKDAVTFWGENPNVLIGSEWFPVETMSYAQKLNAVTRFVVVSTALLFLFTHNLRVLLVSALTMAAIWVIYYFPLNKEGFKYISPTEALLENVEIPNLFDTISSTNPLGNVLMTDYDAAANKKPAPPSYTQHSQAAIVNQTKQMVAENNPQQPDIADKLYQSLDDQLSLEQSLRPFFSNPSTTIPNDQGAFADFCYGSMVSCKEGNPFACARNLARHEL